MNKFPRPQNFQYKEVFYFDDEVALIKGVYNNSDFESIGMRWMVGESDLGYPSSFGNITLDAFVEIGLSGTTITALKNFGTSCLIVTAF